MAIKEEEQKKNGMTIIDNMDGAKSAEDKLNIAKVSYGKELDKLPGNTLQEKLEKKLGIKVIRNIRLQDAIKLLKIKKNN